MKKGKKILGFLIPLLIVIAGVCAVYYFTFSDAYLKIPAKTDMSGSKYVGNWTELGSDGSSGAALDLAENGRALIKLNGRTEAELKQLKKQVCDIWISNHRQSILTFARECRDEIKHDSEEWAHILSLADEYEVYCQKNTVSNGVVKADTEYIRNLYQELSRDHRI